MKRTCLREGSQKYEDFLPGERILGETMMDLEQHGSRDSLGEDLNIIQICVRIDKKNTSKDFVATFPTEHHLHTHGFDFAAEEVHGRTCSDRGDIVSLKMINDFWNCIQTFLYRKNIFMMNRSQIMRGFSRS